MLELTSELQEVEGRDLVSVLTDVMGSAWAEVWASLAVAYFRKEHEQREDVWPAKSPYRNDHSDHYVLTVEIRVPMTHTTAEMDDLVNASMDALLKAKVADLEAKRTGLQTELDRVQSAIAEVRGA